MFDDPFVRYIVLLAPFIIGLAVFIQWLITGN